MNDSILLAYFALSCGRPHERSRSRHNGSQLSWSERVVTASVCGLCRCSLTLARLLRGVFSPRMPLGPTPGGRDTKGGRGKLPPFARMGMMKKYYSDAEWAKRLKAYENKEKPSAHAALYSKDRWEDKNSGKKLFCCFKCRTIGLHTMDRCPDFK